MNIINKILLRSLDKGIERTRQDVKNAYAEITYRYPYYGEEVVQSFKNKKFTLPKFTCVLEVADAESGHTNIYEFYCDKFSDSCETNGCQDVFCLIQNKNIAYFKALDKVKYIKSMRDHVANGGRVRK